MIILDNVASEGTAVDNSIPDDGTKKDALKAEDASEDDEAASESAADEDPEADDMPVAKKAITADDDAQKGEEELTNTQMMVRMERTAPARDGHHPANTDTRQGGKDRGRSGRDRG